MKILITGATGFLGRALVDYYYQNNNEKWIRSNLVLLGHSEKRADFLRRKYNVEVLVGDVNNKSFLEKIFINNKVEKVIHSSAVKYVSVSNENPTYTIETNVFGSYNILTLCQKYGVSNLVGISTDKAINPTTIYGMTKKLMEEMYLEHGFTIVSGVNFFGSSGSVLDVWFEQFKTKKALTLTEKSCIRYFVEIEDVASIVVSSFGKNEIVAPEKVLRVKIGDLLEIFMESFDYSEYIETGLLPGEKIEEELSLGTNIVDAKSEDLRKMISKWKLHNYY